MNKIIIFLLFFLFTITFVFVLLKFR